MTANKLRVTPAARLTWEKIARSEWRSTCQRYRVWVQSRPRGEPPYYAAEVLGLVAPTESVGHQWLCDSAAFAEAKQLCQLHADGQLVRTGTKGQRGVWAQVGTRPGETTKTTVAPTPSLKIGDPVWWFDSNRRRYTEAKGSRMWGDLIWREQYAPMRIVAETRVSWLVNDVHEATAAHRESLRLKKADVATGVAERLGWAYSEGHIDRLEWANSHRHVIQRCIERREPSELTEVAVMVGRKLPTDAEKAAAEKWEIVRQFNFNVRVDVLACIAEAIGYEVLAPPRERAAKAGRK